MFRFATLALLLPLLMLAFVAPAPAADFVVLPNGQVVLVDSNNGNFLAVNSLAVRSLNAGYGGGPQILLVDDHRPRFNVLNVRNNRGRNDNDININVFNRRRPFGR